MAHNLSEFKSLAEVFQKYPEYVNQYLQWNPEAKLIQNHLIPAIKLKPDIKCQSGNCYAMDKSKPPISQSVNGVDYDDLQNFILCLTCDQLYHLKCAAILQLSNEITPWSCAECRKEPLNSAAVKFFESGNFDLAFDRRIEAFTIDEEAEDSSDSECDATDYSFIDASIHVDRNLDPVNMTKVFYNKFLEQKSEMEKMTELFLQNQRELNATKLEQANAKAKESTKASVSIQRPEPEFFKEQNANPDQETFLTQRKIQDQDIFGKRNRKADAVKTKAKMETSSYAVKILTLNDILSQSQINEPQANSTVNQASNVQSQRSFLSNSYTFNRSQHSQAETIAQENARRYELSEIRKHLPKIEAFDGNPAKWLTFQRAVERNRREGQYSDELIKFHIRAALTGQALSRVEALFDVSSPDEIMMFLKECFGDSNLVVESARKRVINIKMTKPLTHAAAMEVTTTIALYLNACAYAKLPAHDYHLARHIHSQLDPMHQQMYYQFFFEKYPGQTRMETLQAQFEFINNLSKTLPMGAFNANDKDRKAKGEGYQLHTIASSYSTTPSRSQKNDKSDKDDFKYIIRNRDTAPYIGYNMEKVNSIVKRCEICAKTNHFTVECNEFKKMQMDQKYNLVKTKNICQNCLLTTTHASKDCDVKLGCGFNVENGAKCSQKHHISLHRGPSAKKPFKKQQNKSRSNKNQTEAKKLISQYEGQAKSIDDTKQVQSHQVLSSNPVTSNSCEPDKYKGYSIQKFSNGGVSLKDVQQQVEESSVASMNVNEELAISSKRTVKLFKIYIHGQEASATGYAVGDSAAEITLINRALMEDLGLNGIPCALDLQWTNGISNITEAIKLNVTVQGVLPDSKRYELKECYAVDDLSLAPRSLNVEMLKQKFSHLRKIPFESYRDARPVMLIGTRHAQLVEAIESFISEEEGKPIGIRSKLGYAIYGGAPEIYRAQPTAYSANSISENDIEGELTNEQLNQRYEYSCSIENLGIKPVTDYLTRDEKKALELVEEEMRILPDGSVELPLIWKRANKELPKLPNNFAMVKRRQEEQEKRLTLDRLKAYNDNFKELIDMGYVRAATQKDINTKWPNINYIPMSLVVNENKQPIKMRNVYDASAKYQGTSLNDHLLMGPNLLVNILAPLMRMRNNKIAFTADVRQMFHRIRISERDQQCQRILWRENSTDDMQIFIQQVMLFGPKSSPFASQIVKNKTADRFSSHYPAAAHALKEYVYMDDLLSSEPTVEKAAEVATGCIEILKNINWDLVGFQSNSTKLLKMLPPSHVKKEIVPIMAVDEENYTTKVLGIAWKPKTDVFVFQLDRNAFIKLVDEFGHKPTKRMQCSTIARIFDVLGFISHCLIRGKILLQRTWRKKLDWNDQIDDEEFELWKQWLQDLKKVALLEIPRQRFKNLDNLADAESIELHIFADAGVEAIAAVIYMVAVVNGIRQTSFVISKAKVAPLKLTMKAEITEMPRLELLACLIAARLANTVTELHPNLPMKRWFWTDSEIVLHWLTNDNLKLPKHAISPVQEILSISTMDEWCFVDSANNAADLATKFKPQDFSDYNTTWFHGPKFLKLPMQHWPTQKVKRNESVALLNINVFEEKFNLPIRLPPTDCPLATSWIIDLLSPSIFDNWAKLVRAVARALKLYFECIIPLLKNNSLSWNDQNVWRAVKANTDLDLITPSDIERSQLFLVRRMQRESFQPDYNRMLKGKRAQSKELTEISAFMDHDGVIRIDSRVNLPHDEYPQRFSPLLPRKSTLTRALLFYYHKKFSHVCIEAQIAEFRAHYWMASIRQELQNIKEECNHCIWLKANPQPPKMAPLPAYRIDVKLRPFQVTGLDCAGPFEVHKRNGSKMKIWILIFTCTLTRFIHLHILDSMDALHVLEAIVAVYTAHGPIAQLISDNGTNFVGAARTIHQERAKLVQTLKDCNDVNKMQLAEKYYLKWNFIPVQSPWFGAFYERLIKEVKRAIATSIERRKIHRIEFSIALQEAAHRINCRPLTHNSISHKDEEPLTPHHLAKYRSGWPLLPSIHNAKESNNPTEDKSVYARGRKLADDIMRKFVSYYLPVLTRRTKWFKDVEPIKKDDLVLLIDPNKTRTAWERARVVKVYPAKDGRVRVADVMLADKSIRKNRSVQRLAKLDLATA